MYIGICIIAYNRINSLKRVLKSIEKAYYGKDSIELVISIDKSSTNIVEEYAKQYKWRFGNKRIITHPHNLGLRNHVLKCGNLLDEFDAIIVLEDDVYVAQNYYLYSKECINKFKDNENIAGISLYNFPINYHNLQPFKALHCDSDIYLMQNAQSWGQIWMKQQWKEFIEWYHRNNEEFSSLPHLPNSICTWPKSSWLKYHTRYCIENNKYFVYPYISLSTCFGDTGTHTANYSTHIQSSLLYGLKRKYNLNTIMKYDAFFENETIYKYLSIDKENLCIDFYGEKKNKLNKRFYLTRKILPYKIIKSYALALKPYEMNIINELDGQELFLYDTTIPRKKQSNTSIEKLFNFYMYGIDISLLAIIKRHIKKMVNRK